MSSAVESMPPEQAMTMRSGSRFRLTKNCRMASRSMSLRSQRGRDQLRVHVLDELLHLAVGDADDEAVRVVVWLPVAAWVVPARLHDPLPLLPADGGRGRPLPS